MPWGKTCLRRRSEIVKVRLRASTFLVWLHALSATIAHAAPAASHRSDSTPREVSRAVRTDEAGSGFMRRGHYTNRSTSRQDQAAVVMKLQPRPEPLLTASKQLELASA